MFKRIFLPLFLLTSFVTAIHAEQQRIILEIWDKESSDISFDLMSIESVKAKNAHNFEHCKLSEKEIRSITIPTLIWGNSSIKKELFYRHILYIEAFVESNSANTLLDTVKANPSVCLCFVALPKESDPFRDFTQFFHYVNIGDIALADIEQLLIQFGYDYLENQVSYTSPLALAALNGQIKTSELLLKYGANPNKKNSKQEMTALSIAALEGHLEVVEKLLNAGAHPNTPDDFTDRTPLMNAVIFQHLTVIEKLLANGADPLIKNKFGFTALDYALTPEIKELLQNNK
jgi:ankyrin repeat protein